MFVLNFIRASFHVHDLVHVQAEGHAVAEGESVFLCQDCCCREYHREGHNDCQDLFHFDVPPLFDLFCRSSALLLVFTVIIHYMESGMKSFSSLLQQFLCPFIRTAIP